MTGEVVFGGLGSGLYGCCCRQTVRVAAMRWDVVAAPRPALGSRNHWPYLSPTRSGMSSTPRGRRCRSGVPSLTGGAYINYLSAEGKERVHATYGAEKFARLQALKDRYDPTNLFQLNQNIPPS
jgi:Berberine and berberine like